VLVDIPSLHGFTTYSSVWEVSGADFILPVVCDPVRLGHNRILRELSILIINNDILIMKAHEMHYFSNLFDKVLYMFRRRPLSIILTTLADANRTSMTSTCCMYTVLRYS